MSKQNCVFSNQSKLILNQNSFFLKPNQNEKSIPHIPSHHKTDLDFRAQS